jgi:hypothetical protein
MKHIIRKQIIDLAVDKKLDAFRIQQDISMLYWNDIIPLFEKIFNEICKEGEVVCIDRLEIVISDVSASQMHQRWKIEKLLSEIADQIYDHLSTGNRSNAEVASRQFLSLNIFSQWLFYMEKGVLPWNTISIDNAWYEKVLESLAIEYESGDRLKNLMKTNEKAIERIILQHPVGFIIHLATLLTAKGQERIPHFMEELFQAFLFVKNETVSSAGRRNFEIVVWKKIFSFIVLHPSADASPDNLFRKIIETGFDRVQLGRLTSASELLNSFQFTMPLFKEVKTHLDLLSGKMKKDDFPEPHKKEPTVFTNQSIAENKTGPDNSTELSKVAHNTIEDELISLSHLSKENESDDSGIDHVIVEDGIFVSYAGVVLLHPFLQPLFNNLGCTHAGKFLDHKHQQKALCVLHYLMAGKTEIEEYELAVAKLLTAYPAQQSVDRSMQLTAEEQAECDEMLVDVIAQWEILKNTSPDGLREGFLQRAGKLFPKNDHMCIQVETNSIDVLLDYLPWNLSVIKLPWMKDRLTVEWR